MNTVRPVLHPYYEAIVGFEQTSDLTLNAAYGLVKFTYDIGPGFSKLAPAEPHVHDSRDPKITGQKGPSREFWPHKLATDVVAIGSAWHRGGVAAPERLITLTVGDRAKTIAVFGERKVIGMTGEVPIFSEPAPFVEMPVNNANAYGGCDLRVPMPPSEDLFDILARQFDHPGIYPRNPFGKGYAVEAHLPAHDMLLPNLEDPHDLLTPARFFVRDPSLWSKQPLPWCFDWSSPLMFHRYAWLNESPWFPAAQDAELPEVRRGLLPTNFREMSAAIKQRDEIPLAFLQEASLGMVMRDLTAGTPIAINGMNPEIETFYFRLPAPPHLEFLLGRAWTTVQARLHSIVLLPGHKKMQLSYAATVEALHRNCVPGMLRKIPLAMRVNNGPAIEFDGSESGGETFSAP